MKWSIVPCICFCIGCGDGTAYLTPDAASRDSSIHDQLAIDAAADGGQLHDQAVHDQAVHDQAVHDQATQDTLLSEAGIDAAPAIDQLVADLPPASAQKIVITEFLANPAAVTDANGEWLELYNDSPNTIDLAGWTLRDEGQDDHVIVGPLTIAPGAYLVLARKADPLTNGGVIVDYNYSGFSLSNQDDEILLLDAQGLLVDRVAYTSAWKVSPGNSFALSSPSADNALLGSWCTVQTPWLNSAGDNGSPGEANAACAPSVDGGVEDGPTTVFDAGLDAGAAVDAATADLPPNLDTLLSPDGLAASDAVTSPDINVFDFQQEAAVGLDATLSDGTLSDLTLSE